MEGEKNHNKLAQKAINYGDAGYWDERYSKKKGERFEWLQPYSRLKPIIESCLPKGQNSSILNIGCGNSTIQESLYQDGYHNISNNDISAIVIEEMRASQKEKGMEKMKYDVMDVRKMTYPDQSFDLVIDKSTIDTLMCSENPLLNVAKMVEENHRVLKEGGYYLTISYSQERMTQLKREHVNLQIEKKELKHFQEEGHEVTNYIYIGKRIGIKKLSPEQRELFYSKLAQIEAKEYPPN